MSHARILVVQGDITTLEVDAVVTAANESLCGGGGVDGAIHCAAGPALFEECQTIGICPPGEARITGSYLLPAKYVIHTVGPVWSGGTDNEDETLKACYLASLQLAVDRDLQTVAFPCIATGVYRFPKDWACEIAISTVTQWLEARSLPEQVVFCCFEDEDFRLYQDRLSIAESAS